MRKVLFILAAGIAWFCCKTNAQEILPRISVKNITGRIIVSWRNEYTRPVTTINIQRSFDSLRNYTTIGSILNPQNIENGYADANPPYNKMYYRVFVSFEGGSYLFSSPFLPIKEKISFDTSTKWNPDLYLQLKGKQPSLSDLIQENLLPQNSNDPSGITYPSRRIFTGKDDNIIIFLPDAETKKYIAKFYDDADRVIFELGKLHESYLIVEKVNFVHGGWYHFELFEGGRLVEKNRFFIPK